MQLFYAPHIGDGITTLDSEESRHAVRVLRMRSGDELHVTDGCGNLLRCHIVEADERACVVEVMETVAQRSAAPRLVLAVAPTKNPARMEWLVEKAVEVGVDEVQLLQCDHSERSFLKTDRLQRLALSAMKQSLHTVLPAVQPAVGMLAWLDSLGPLGEGQRFIAHCEEGHPRIPLTRGLQAGKDTLVLIGPEGDFSPNEIDRALACGFQAVSLGPSRLRTETAALYAVMAFNMKNDI